jgi:hypothetical protein
MTTETPFDALRAIKGKPVRLVCSRKVWPMMIFNLAVSTVPNIPLPPLI